MPRFTVFAAAVVGLTAGLAPAQLVTYNPGSATVASSSVPVATVASGLSAGTLGGTGITAVGTGSSFVGTGFSLAASPSGQGYGFTITPSTSGTLDFTGANFSFAGFRSTDGPQKFSLITNVTGTSQNVGTVTPLTSQAGYNISLTGLGSAVAVTGGQSYSFLLDGYNASLVAGSFTLNGTTSLGGAFTPVPEPAALLAVAGLGLAAARRRRV